MRAVVQMVVGLALVASVAGAAAPASPGWKRQLQFGVDMAARGLWAEARFRFGRADAADPRNPRILNNLAVASEALGRFEEALELYRRALELAPAEREIRGNYDRFLGFYEGYKAREAQQSADGATPAEEAPPDVGTAPTATPPDATAPPEATPPEGDGAPAGGQS